MKLNNYVKNNNQTEEGDEESFAYLNKATAKESSVGPPSGQSDHLPTLDDRSDDNLLDNIDIKISSTFPGPVTYLGPKDQSPQPASSRKSVRHYKEASDALSAQDSQLSQTQKDYLRDLL